MAATGLQKPPFEPCAREQNPKARPKCEIHEPMARLRNRIRENRGLIAGNLIFLSIIFTLSAVVAYLFYTMFRIGETALAPLPVLTPFVSATLASLFKYNDFISVPVKLGIMRGLHGRAVETCVSGKGPGTIPAEIGDYLGGK